MPLSRKPHPKASEASQGLWPRANASQARKASEQPAKPAESRLITSVRIAPALNARFEQYARENGLSKSGAINKLLAKHLP